MFEHALEYRQRGLSVFPVAMDKTPLVEWANWQRELAHPDQVAVWWGRWPQANIGVATGALSNLVVLDADGPEGLAALRDLVGPPGSTWLSQTGRLEGGWQEFFAHPGLPVYNRVGLLDKGLDVRGDGGYTILPPSLHASGRRYTWIAGPSDLPLAPLPERVLTLLRQPPAPQPRTIDAIPEGRRNDHLYRMARALGARGLGESAVCAALLEENGTRCQPSLPEAEVLAIAHHAARQPHRTDFIERPRGHAIRAMETQTPQAVETQHLTDLGNARRLVKLCGDDLRYVAARKEWLVWTGTHWSRDETGQVFRYAKAVVLGIYAEAAACADDEERRALVKHARASESVRALQAMVTVAQTEPEIVLTVDALDQDPWALNCQNGTLDLQTGILREHRREDLITRVIPVAYDPEAPCPMFEAFLERIFVGRPALIGFLRRAIGYALTGDTREHALFLCWGSGANGKTTLMQAVAGLLADYAAQLAAETLLARKGDATVVLNDLASLQGARFVVAVESDLGRRLAEALVKQLTGGEPIRVKRLYADLYTIRPSFKLWLGTNHRPVIRGTDLAIWRRIRLIPFEVSIPEAEQDRCLLDKLRNEAPGILAWAVRGCLEWLRDGLGTPEEIREATASYRYAMDSIGDFLSECCILDPVASVSSADLYTAYTDWAKNSGETPLSKKALGLQLADRGELVASRSSRRRLWVGLRLRTPADDLLVTDQGER